jgi:hypothetical protein
LSSLLSSKNIGKLYVACGRSIEEKLGKRGSMENGEAVNPLIINLEEMSEKESDSNDLSLS